MGSTLKQYYLAVIQIQKDGWGSGVDSIYDEEEHPSKVAEVYQGDTNKQLTVYL